MNRRRGWRGQGLGGLAALALLTHCGVSTEQLEQAHEEASPPARATTKQALVTTLTFPASADARVEQGAPSQNFGGASTLGADLSPSMESYLRFSLSGVTGAVSTAKLRLYTVDGTSDGPQVYLAASGWTESSLTWNTRPARVGGPLDDTGALPHGAWVEYDVTGAVSGDGELNLALLPSATNGADFSSREEGQAHLRPQLVVTFSQADCMPRREHYISELYPSADGYVSQEAPFSNFGSEPALLVDGASRLESYLQFRLRTTTFPLIDARLELYAFDPTSNGPLLYRTRDDWTEAGLTWDTRPGLLGAPVGDLGAISANSWVAYDVTDVVTGPGTYSFGLLPESSNGVDFRSHEYYQDFPLPFPRLRLTAETPSYCSYHGTGGGLTDWARQLGGAGDERLTALAMDAQGGFVVAGLFGEAIFPENEGFALARYSADGTHLWTRVLATDDVFVSNLAVTPEGSILVMGNYEGSPDLGTGPLPRVPDGADERIGFFIARFSPLGELVWLRSFVPTQGDFDPVPAIFPGELITDASGNIILSGGLVGEVDLGGGPLEQGLEGISGWVARFSRDGQHLWSRVFATDLYSTSSIAGTVSTDAEGNILLGGSASAESDLGAGPLGEAGAFIAKYTPGGSLVWTRLFSGLERGSRVSSVRAVDAQTVAFSALFEGTFTFGGQTYTGGDPEDPLDRGGGFVGTLSAAGEDGWLRSQGSVLFGRISVGPGGTLTVPGSASGEFTLGGGPLGMASLYGSFPFAVRYSRSGAHLWSRTFDRELELDHLGVQPDGATLLGGIIQGQVALDGQTLTPQGRSDLFYLRLRP